MQFLDKRNKIFENLSDFYNEFLFWKTYIIYFYLFFYLIVGLVFFFHIPTLLNFNPHFQRVI